MLTQNYSVLLRTTNSEQQIQGKHDHVAISAIKFAVNVILNLSNGNWQMSLDYLLFELGAMTSTILSLQLKSQLI